MDWWGFHRQVRLWVFLVAGIFLKVDKLDGVLPETQIASSNLFEVYWSKLLNIAWESFVSLLPIIIVYILFQIFSFKHKKRKVVDISRGIFLTFAGLVIFLLGVNGGFMELGAHLGVRLASLDSKIPVLLVALLLGLSTVLAEPAVLVLTHQVEDVTGGSVNRLLVLIFLSVAVGASIFMSAIRILVPGIQLWMYILPGFGLSVLLSYFVSDLFVGIAFDAGGVASGPMTATFSLAFVQGIAAHVPTADVVTDGFGMIAIVAMMPILAIQLLGALYQAKSRKASAAAVIEKSNLEVIMDNNEKHPTGQQFQILTLILSEHQCHKCVQLARENGICGGILTLGKGTVNSSVLNLLGIKSQKREVVSFLMEKGQGKKNAGSFH